MTLQQNIARYSAPRDAQTTATKQYSERRMTADLIDVLRPHRQGLRRWSVMRALRTRREAEGCEISQKFEDDVERVFRRLCVDATGNNSSSAVFYRPPERAGEVWAVYADRADAWLGTNGVSAA